MLDTLIVNGWIADGTGNPTYPANVAIEGDRIVEVGNIAPGSHTAERTIDAGGNVVMPGLINTHHHLYSTFARGFTPPGPPARTGRP